MINKRFKSMVRVCAYAVLSMLVLSSAHAVTLGDIKTTSYLNEPLNFAIPVKIGRDESVSVDSFRVSLASSDEYARQGLVYPWGVGSIRLNVVKGRNDLFYINGRSTKPVKDLIVYILVDVSWPSGHMQKEYSTLVDLRGVSDEPAILKRKTPAAIVKPAQSNASVRVQRTSPSQASARVERTQSSRNPVRTSGFQSTQDYVDYTVKRGDALSLIAQRLRGDVKLPLHRYIQAITQANNDTFKKGLGNLEVGQVIRIPNPNLVAQKQHSNDRRLERAQTGAPSQYRVKYGDSLFLIAKAFKPSNVDMDAYINALREANAGKVGRSNFLEPGVVLTIPNPNDDAVQMAQKTTDQTPEQQKSGAVAPNETPVQAVPPTPSGHSASPVDVAENSTEQPIAEATPISDLKTLGAEPQQTGVSETLQTALPDSVSDVDEMAVSDGRVAEQEVLAAIENNLALKKEIEQLKNNIRHLESNVTTLKRDNQNLTANIVNFNEQQHKSPENTNFLLWGLLAFLVLLAGLCLFLFGRMRQLANAVAKMAVQQPSENVVSVHNPAYAPEEPQEKGFVGLFKRKERAEPEDKEDRDYSDYDFSKSNYDYSKLYDVDRLKEEIKSTGSDAFVMPSAMDAIEIADAEEDLSAVKEFIDSGHYEAAEKLLNELIAKHPKDIDNRLLLLELEVKRGNEESANAMVAELLALFPDEESQNLIKSQVVSSRLELAEQARESVEDDAQVFDITTEMATGLTMDVESYDDVSELSSETLDAMLMQQEAKGSEEQENADALYEVKVYMSYGHDDMARTSLDEYLARRPEDTNALILKLELLAREQSKEAVDVLANKLRAEHELSEDHKNRIDEIFKKMKEGDFTDSLGDALKSTALMVDDDDRTEFMDDNMTSFIQDAGADDELSLEEDEFMARVREQAENQDKPS